MTFRVSKFDKLIFVKEEHPISILLISLTSLVLKLDKFNFIKALHPLNKEFTLVNLFLNEYFII